MSKKPVGRHERQPIPRRHIATASLGIAVAVVAVSAIALGVGTSAGGTPGASREGKGRPAPAAQAPSPAPQPAASSTAGADTARRQASAVVGTCRLANLRQEADLGTAAAAMSSWARHIEAMNLLVAGRISLAVATDFWASSRVGASKGIADFRSADRAYALSSSGRCAPLEGPAVAGAPTTAGAAVRECSAALGLGDAALTRARPALSTWEHHIHDMDALLAGRITPGQAVARWQHSWRAGNAQLEAYRASVAAMAGAKCTIG